MPIRIPDALPAHDILESENIFVMTEYRAMHQNIRPLNLLILNLMPTKIVTETQLLRMLSNTPLQIQVDFLQTASYTSTHTDIHHLQQFYYTFDQIRNRRYDGMIITGAPLDYVPCEETLYWDEVCKIMEWSKTHVHCTFHLCWGAYAGMESRNWICQRNCLESIPMKFARRPLHCFADLMTISWLHIPEQPMCASQM